MDRTLAYYRNRQDLDEQQIAEITGRVTKTLYIYYQWFEISNFELKDYIPNNSFILKIQDSLKEVSSYFEYIDDPQSIQPIKVLDTGSSTSLLQQIDQRLSLAELNNLIWGELLYFDNQERYQTILIYLGQYLKTKSDDITEQLSIVNNNLPKIMSELDTGQIIQESASQDIQFWTKIAVGQLVFQKNVPAYLKKLVQPLSTLIQKAKEGKENPLYILDDEDKVVLKDLRIADQVWNHLQWLDGVYLDTVKLDNLSILPNIGNDYLVNPLEIGGVVVFGQVIWQDIEQQFPVDPLANKSTELLRVAGYREEKVGGVPWLYNQGVESKLFLYLLMLSNKFVVSEDGEIQSYNNVEEFTEAVIANLTKNISDPEEISLVRQKIYLLTDIAKKRLSSSYDPRLKPHLKDLHIILDKSGIPVRTGYYRLDCEILNQFMANLFPNIMSLPDLEQVLSAMNLADSIDHLIHKPSVLRSVRSLELYENSEFREKTVFLRLMSLFIGKMPDIDNVAKIRQGLLDLGIVKIKEPRIFIFPRAIKNFLNKLVDLKIPKKYLLILEKVLFNKQVLKFLVNKKVLEYPESIKGFKNIPEDIAELKILAQDWNSQASEDYYSQNLEFKVCQCFEGGVISDGLVSKMKFLDKEEKISIFTEIEVIEHDLLRKEMTIPDLQKIINQYLGLSKNMLDSNYVSSEIKKLLVSQEQGKVQDFFAITAGDAWQTEQLFRKKVVNVISQQILIYRLENNKIIKSKNLRNLPDWFEEEKLSYWQQDLQGDLQNYYSGEIADDQRAPFIYLPENQRYQTVNRIASFLKYKIERPIKNCTSIIQFKKFLNLEKLGRKEKIFEIIDRVEELEKLEQLKYQEILDKYAIYSEEEEQAAQVLIQSEMQEYFTNEFKKYLDYLKIDLTRYLSKRFIRKTTGKIQKLVAKPVFPLLLRHYISR